LARKETNGPGDKVGEFGIAQVADAVTGIEVFIHAAGIPPEQFVLLMPCEGAFRGERLLEDGVALLFEAEQDFLRQRASLAERDEIRAALFLDMWKHASEMEAADERVWPFV
jgi:hypothetical protein